MTKVSYSFVKCFRCGKESKQMSVQSVNFSLGSKEDNEELLQHKQKCPFCGFEAAIIGDFVNSRPNKKLLYKIEGHNWSEKTADDWDTITFDIYDNLDCDYYEFDGTGKEIERLQLKLSKEDLEDIDKNIELARSNGMKVDAFEGEAWKFVKYDDGQIVWQRPLGYIYNIEPLETIIEGLYKLAEAYYEVEPEKNEAQIVYGPPDFFRNQDKYDVKPEDNVPQKVYGVYNPPTDNYDVEPEKNVPQEVYGIYKPPVENYDVKPEDNVPQKVYGVFNPAVKQEESIHVNIKKSDIQYILDIKHNEEGTTLYVGNYDINSKDRCITINDSDYSEFKKQFKELTSDYISTDMYQGNKNITWTIRFDSNNENTSYSGYGEVPVNWNELMDLFAKYERIYKKNEKK